MVLKKPCALLSVRQVAIQTGLPRSVVRMLVMEGELEAVGRPSKPKIKASSVEALVRKMSQTWFSGDRPRIRTTSWEQSGPGDLAAARIRLGKTQTELADEINRRWPGTKATQSVVSQVECGKVTAPLLDQKMRAVLGFDVPVDDGPVGPVIFMETSN